MSPYDTRRVRELYFKLSGPEWTLKYTDVDNDGPRGKKRGVCQGGIENTTTGRLKKKLLSAVM